MPFPENNNDVRVANQTWTICTPVAGVTVTALHVASVAASRPILGLYGKTTGRTLVINRINLSVASGTAGAGGFVLAGFASSIVTAASSVATRHSTLNTGTPAGAPYADVVLTGASATRILRYLGGPTTGAVAANGNLSIEYVGDGRIQVPAGGFLGV